MININNIRKIGRKRKYMIGISPKPRERNVCPVCNSLDVIKRKTTQDYYCHNCRWRGKSIIKIMVWPTNYKDLIRHYTIIIETLCILLLRTSRNLILHISCMSNYIRIINNCYTTLQYSWNKRKKIKGEINNENTWIRRREKWPCW